MNSDLAASRLVVLSDLHLSPPGEHCVFDAHEPLVTLIEHLTDVSPNTQSQCLVLNGDVFDFLQIPGYEKLSLPLAPERMKNVLDALDSGPPSHNVVQALRRYTAAGHRLFCLPGNHDPELNLHSVQQVLAQRLGSSSALPPSAGQWKLNVAGRLVNGLHGHHLDAFNAISSERMRRAQADGDECVPMPPGSRLVCQVINPFRRAKTPEGKRRFPFIDQLPSDQAVVLAIMLLDPRLAGRRLKDSLGIGAAALVRRALSASGIRRPTLSEGGSTAPATPNGLEWVDELACHVTAAATELQENASASTTSIDYELDAYFAGYVASSSPRSDSLSGGHNIVRDLLLRALAHALATARTAFPSNVPDTLAQRMMMTMQASAVTITGHTHAAKELALSNGAIYLNTGTWLDQVVPPHGIDVSSLPDWLARLQRNEIPTWNGYPVAVVDGEDARLMRWSGRALIPWRDAMG